MKRHPQPEAPPPPPIDRARVRELVEQLRAAACAGESIHATGPVYELDDLVGSCMAGYYVVLTLGFSDDPPSVDKMVAHIVKHAERWAEDARRIRDP
jgi:hypothetical protein